MRSEENTRKRKWVEEDANSPQEKRTSWQRGKNLEVVYLHPISFDPEPTPDDLEEDEGEREEREARRRFNLRIRRLPMYIVAPRPAPPGPPKRQYVPDEGVPGFWTIQAERRRAMRKIQGTRCPVCGEEYTTLPRKTFRTGLREPSPTNAAHHTRLCEHEQGPEEPCLGHLGGMTDPDYQITIHLSLRAVFL